MLALRPYVASTDENFVRATWSRSYKQSRDVGPVPSNLYWPLIGATITELLDRPASVTTVAVSADDHEQILGYVCHEPNKVVHYIFVKETFRRLGVGRVLLNHATGDRDKFTYTFRTQACRNIPAPFDGTYNPAHVRRKPIGDARH